MKMVMIELNVRNFEQNSDECTHRNQTTANGFYVCIDCGECLEQEYSDKERVFKEDQDVSHTITTKGVFGDRTTFNPNSDGVKNKALFIRLYKRKERRTGYERKMAYSLTLMKQLIENFNLPIPVTLYDPMMSFLRKVFQAVHFKVVDHLILASMCIVCRDAHVALGVKDIAEKYSKLHDKRKPSEVLELRKGITSSISQILEVLHIGISPITHRQVASQILAKLNPPQEVALRIYKALEHLDASDLSGKDKRGTVAAVIYCLGTYTQHELSAAVNVSEVTIRQRIKFLKREHFISVTEDEE
jgi:transcription initiation factor TFIIIB Brf1 subunit/transcription initiation factor TFIIB